MTVRSCGGGAGDEVPRVAQGSLPAHHPVRARRSTAAAARPMAQRRSARARETQKAAQRPPPPTRPAERSSTRSDHNKQDSSGHSSRSAPARAVCEGRRGLCGRHGRQGGKLSCFACKMQGAERPQPRPAAPPLHRPSDGGLSARARARGVRKSAVACCPSEGGLVRVCARAGGGSPRDMPDGGRARGDRRVPRWRAVQRGRPA